MTRSNRLPAPLLAVLLTGAIASAQPIPLTDEAFMVPFYTGTILPTPQQVTYRDEFAPLGSTGLLLGKDVPQDDPRLKLLTERITQYGGRAAAARSLSDNYETFVCVGNTDAGKALLQGRSAPNKPQGYLIHCARTRGKHVVLLQGSDRQGLLWAIISLDQLITRRDGKPAVRLAEVLDFPANASRGFITTGSPRPVAQPGVPGTCALVSGWFAVRAKLNKIVFSSNLLVPRGSDWRGDRPEFVKEDIRETGALLSPLGIEWYMGLNPASDFRSKNEEDFRTLYGYASLAAAAGGGFCYMQDDGRFPIHPDDMRDFGSAREADLYFLNRLHQALKEKYPQAKLIFCPPFYWGPDSPANYPEPREEYLRALGQRLPKEIGVFWTGPRVKSGQVTREQVQWMADLIQRKPLFWQNRFGAPHVYGYHYVTDPLPAWKERYYDGFTQDLDTYMLNSDAGMCIVLMTLADYLWNPGAYDPARSVEDAAKKLTGPESWPALGALNEKLSYFDQYGGRLTPIAARNLPEMERKMEEVDDALAQALAIHPRAVTEWTSMPGYVGVQKGFVAGVKRNPDLSSFTAAAEQVWKSAEADIHLAKETDLLLSPYDFAGGMPAENYSLRCEKRLATWIYGARTANPAMKAQFECDPFPPAADYQLILSGQDDDAEKECRIRITVNGTRIFEGESGFARFGWSRRNFTVPVAALKRQNALTIENIEDTDRAGGPPYFMLNYAVLRR